jgi:hypothetical protein
MGIVKKLSGTIDLVGELAQLGMETQSATRSVLVPQRKKDQGTDRNWDSITGA